MNLDSATWRGLLTSGGLYAAAFATLTLSGMTRSTWTIVLAAVLLLVAAAMLERTLAAVREQDMVRPAVRWAIPGAVIAIGLCLVVYWYFARPTGGWLLCGLCAFYLGVGHAVAEARSQAWGAPWRGALWLGGCVLLIGLGIGLTLAVAAPWLAVSLVALLAAPIGLSLLSGDVMASRELRLWPVLGVGLVLAVAGLIGLKLAGVPWLFVVLLATTVLLLVGAIASNTQADVLLVVTMLALVWTATPHGVALDEYATVAPGQRTLVSLGDSYMSGEGAQEFYDGTNDADVNECRRAPTAYAHLVVEPGRASAMERLAFLACSGARARHVHDEAQWRGEPIDDDPSVGTSQLDQLATLLADADIDISLVVVSIGGNDAGFADVGIACLAPGSCVERGQIWLDELQEVAPKVDRAYQEIRSVVGMDVPVLVVPYPEPIRERRCSYSLLTNAEHEFLYGFVRQLNGIVRQAAKDAGFYYLNGMTTALADRRLRICDGAPDRIGVNFLALKSVNGLADQAVNPANWWHNSLHPNERGHVVMAETLEGWLVAHPDAAPKPYPDSDPDPFSIAPLTTIMADADVEFCGQAGAQPDYCDRAGTPWVVTQVALFLRGVSLPALLLGVGCWLIWLPLLQRTSRRTVKPPTHLSEAGYHRA